MSEIGLPYYVCLLAGLALCPAETEVPGAFRIWIGAAGLILGAVEFFAPMTLTVQRLAFAALVVALVPMRTVSRLCSLTTVALA